jgi:hypothetical protein
MNAVATLKAGLAEHRAGNLKQAEQLYRASLSQGFAHPALFQNLGVLLKVTGREAQAEAIFRKGIQTTPSHQLGLELSHLLLGQGRWEEGWPLYEHRIGLVATEPALSFPKWRGEPLDGRSLLIWWEQGFGDQIQFARFAPLLARQASVTILAGPELAELFETLAGVKVIRAEGAVDIPRHDYWTLPCSIPQFLSVTPDTLPSAPYLHAASRGGGGVGVVTCGNPRHLNDAHRSLDAASALRLKKLGRSLAPEDTGAAIFKDTAEIVAGLDLVVTVDTSVAHLAGALGKPVWILLPAIKTDWRWLKGRLDTPWYPSARLFRQRAAGQWGAVVDEVVEALATSGRERRAAKPEL